MVLIDEYDKPILDNITGIRPSRARCAMACATSIRCSRAGRQPALPCSPASPSSARSRCFSGLNNLNDITVDARYSAICGYTDEDVDQFRPELPGLDRDEIRRWYNGYNWTGKSVYKPFDLLLLFRPTRGSPLLVPETGTPTFLVDVLGRDGGLCPALEQLVAAGLAIQVRRRGHLYRGPGVPVRLSRHRAASNEAAAQTRYHPALP